MYVRKTKSKTKREVEKVNCQGHIQNNEGGCVVQQWAWATGLYTALERSEI